VDFKGLKFRTGPDAAELLNALGIVGVAMPTGDMYNGLQQGVVTGVAGVANNVYDRALYEVCKYWVDPGFWNPVEVMLVNLDRWNTIPKDLQNLMLDVAKEIEPTEYDYQSKNNEKYFQKFKDVGMKAITFSPEDTKWYLDIAYQVRWDTAKKLMKPEDYTRAYQLWGK
jgi:TRAP-type C4-dicarboxylate transport system substrate-binding protein